MESRSFEVEARREKAMHGGPGGREFDCCRGRAG